MNTDSENIYMEDAGEGAAEAVTTGRPSLAVRIWRFYIDGFKSMTIGRYLWAIILIKLAVMFLVFKLFFFPNILSRDYDTDEDRAQAVRTNLINNK